VSSYGLINDKFLIDGQFTPLFAKDTSKVGVSINNKV